METTIPEVKKESLVDSKEVKFSRDIRELREELWVTGVALVLQLSLPFVFLINYGYIYCLWILVVLVILSYFVFWYKRFHEFHKYSLFGVFLLVLWLIYYLLPWGVKGNVILDYVIQILGVAVSLGYWLLERDYFIPLQMLLLVYPFSKSAGIDINVLVLFYTFAWYMITISDHSLGEKFTPIRFAMAVVPLLRSYTAVFMSYFILVCILKTVQLYTSGDLPTRNYRPLKAEEDRETGDIETPDSEEEEEEERAPPPEKIIEPQIIPPKEINIKKPHSRIRGGGPVQIQILPKRNQLVRRESTPPPPPPPTPSSSPPEDSLGVSFTSLYGRKQTNDM